MLLVIALLVLYRELLAVRATERVAREVQLTQTDHLVDRQQAEAAVEALFFA